MHSGAGEPMLQSLPASRWQSWDLNPGSWLRVLREFSHMGRLVSTSYLRCFGRQLEEVSLLSIRALSPASSRSTSSITFM